MGGSGVAQLDNVGSHEKLLEVKKRCYFILTQTASDLNRKSEATQDGDSGSGSENEKALVPRSTRRYPLSLAAGLTDDA
jgi:hypothetical protein